MTPHRTLTILVAFAAALILGAWVILFRNGVLAPPMVAPNGASLDEVSREFTRTISEFQAATERASRTPPTTSDDAIVSPEKIEN